MRIGMTTFGCDGGKSGIGQYAIHLLRELPGLQTGIEVEAMVHESEREIFVGSTPLLSALCLDDRLKNPPMNLLWHQCALPRWCKRRAYDVLFLPAANRRIPAMVPCPTVGTVHDFSSIHMKGKYDPLRVFYITQVLPFLVRRLTHVIAVSESTKRDLVTFARVPGERVTVIPHGVDLDRYFPRDPEAVRARVGSRYGLIPPYLLYISRLEHPGKNHVRLIHAFERLKATAGIPHQLVLAGSDWTRAEYVHRAAEASPYRRDIRFTGYAPSEDLPDLYGGADLFVFPSLYEGFGMPLLEAMACAAPVACSNVSSLPEVVGEAGALFDPHDEEAMAATIKEVLLNPGLRRHYVEKGLERVKHFTWRTTAARTLEVILDAARAHKKRSHV
jgi:glycosyltransferase involved in cell wall biosynthesis